MGADSLAGEHVEVPLVGVDTVAALAGGLLQDSSLLKGFYRLDRRGFADAQQLDGQWQRHDRARGKKIQKPDRRNGHAVVTDQSGSVFAEQREEPLDRPDAVVGGLADALEVERGPALPIAAVAHRRQMRVVLLLTPLEREAEVQHGTLEEAPVLEKQCDEQTADAAVAIQKRMDRLELHVCQPSLDQRRQRIVRVEPLLELGHELGHDLRRRRNEPGVPWPRSADPVL